MADGIVADGGQAFPYELDLTSEDSVSEVAAAVRTLAPGESGYSVFDVSAALREQGWLVPAYTFPADRQDLAVLRIVVRNGFSHDLADLLIEAIERALPRLRAQRGPARGDEAASFSHAADARPSGARFSADGSASSFGGGINGR